MPHVTPDGCTCYCSAPKECAAMSLHSFLKARNPDAFGKIPETKKLTVRREFLQRFHANDGAREIREIEAKLADLGKK